MCIFFRDIYPEKFSGFSRLHYDTYFEKTQYQAHETISAGEPSSPWTSVLLNQTILENPEDFAKSLLKMWVPRCNDGNDYTTPCTLGFMMHLTLPRHDDDIAGTLKSKVSYCFTE